MSKKMKRLALIGVPVLIVLGALVFWLQGGRHISTENAFVKADIAQIASEIPGRIIDGSWRTTRRALVSFVDGVSLQAACCPPGGACGPGGCCPPGACVPGGEGFGRRACGCC